MPDFYTFKWLGFSGQGQDYMKTVGQMQAFLGNGDQHVVKDCDPDLRLDRVLFGAIKRLDSQVTVNKHEGLRY